jgi:hypothetical protein
VVSQDIIKNQGPTHAVAIKKKRTSRVELLAFLQGERYILQQSPEIWCIAPLSLGAAVTAEIEGQESVAGPF